MQSVILNEENVRKKLALIIKEIGHVDLVDDDASLFGFTYNLSAETLIYILLRASKEFGFKINDAFIDSLGDYSFRNMICSVVDHTSSQIAN